MVARPPGIDDHKNWQIWPTFTGLISRQDLHVNKCTWLADSRRSILILRVTSGDYKAPQKFLKTPGKAAFSLQAKVRNDHFCVHQYSKNIMRHYDGAFGLARTEHIFKIHMSSKLVINL